MKRFKILTVFVLTIFVLIPVSLPAFDAGIVANIRTEYDNTEETFEFKADLLPRFSALIGDNAEIYLSAGLSFGSNNENNFFFIPELLRSEFTMRFGNAGISAGRIHYSDPLSFIADGLFDGLQFYLNSAFGRLSLGAWYTGSLYKKNAHITMTVNDQEKFEEPLDYSNFFDTYFSSSRVIAALEWNHPSIGEFLNLHIAAIGQFDLNNADNKYNSQYFIVTAGVPVRRFLFQAGGSFGLSQTTVSDTSGATDTSGITLAGDFGVFWMLPVNIQSRLSFTAKIAGGEVNDQIAAFVPVTTKYFGNIYKQKMSGLTVLNLNYLARVHRSVGLSLLTSYFIGSSNDVTGDADSDNGNLLGPEIFARVVWSPASDLQFNLGGGAFFPSLGNAGLGDEIRWRVDLTAAISLF